MLTNPYISFKNTLWKPGNRKKISAVFTEIKRVRDNTRHH